MNSRNAEEVFQLQQWYLLGTDRNNSDHFNSAIRREKHNEIVLKLLMLLQSN